VKGLYKLIYREAPEIREDGVLNLIILTEALFKMSTIGFNYDDLHLLTMAVDQDIYLKNDYYYDLAIKLLDDWRVERSYGRRARYVFRPHIKAAITILSNRFRDEAVCFKFEKRDFKKLMDYYSGLDSQLSSLDVNARTSSLRVQAGLGRLSMLIGDSNSAIEFHKKTVRLGNAYINAEKSSKIVVGSFRLIGHIMADSFLELGYITECKERYREAMSFYSAAYFVSKAARRDYNKTIDKVLEFIPTNSEDHSSDAGDTLTSIKADMGAIFYISEEGIDALNHMAYLLWKLGKIDSAKRLFQHAVALSEKKYNPYKSASQYILFGYFLFNINQLKEAKKIFKKVFHKPDENNLPVQLVNAAREGYAYCCQCNDLEYEGAQKVLKPIFGSMDSKRSIQSIFSAKCHLLRVHQASLQTNGETHDNDYVRLVNNTVMLMNNYKEEFENDVSVRMSQYFYAQVAYGFFSVMESNVSDFFSSESNPSKDDISANAFNFIDRCSSFFLTAIENCKISLKSIKEQDGYLDSANHFITIFKPKDQEKNPMLPDQCFNMLRLCKTYIAKNRYKTNTITSRRIALSEVYFIIEQILLQAYRKMQMHTFVSTSVDNAAIMGIFYFQVSRIKVPMDGIDLERRRAAANKAKEFFKLSLKKKAIRHLPNQCHYEAISHLFLGDLEDPNFVDTEIDNEIADFNKWKDDQIKHYAFFLHVLANDFEASFARIPLSREVKLRESTLLPREHMHVTARNRCRLRHWLSGHLTHKEINLDDFKKARKLVSYLRGMANSVSPTGKEEHPLIKEVKLWREVIIQNPSST
ncbi:MAG: hypothetical protein Q9M22_00790, partial [Mariprofundaceae bacterium]|nr:hypothetical protein [Mariprofundaceae bacterium]